MDIMGGNLNINFVDSTCSAKDIGTWTELNIVRGMSLLKGITIIFCSAKTGVDIQRNKRRLKMKKAGLVIISAISRLLIGRALVSKCLKE